MKRLLLIVFLLMFTSNCSHAGELQKQYDEQQNNKLPEKIDYLYILKEDYKTYLNGKGDSVFGLLKNDYENINLSSIKSREINLKYLQLITNNIDNAVNNGVLPLYIDISDSEFSVLDDKVKRDLGIYNSFAEKPKIQSITDNKTTGKQKGKKFLKGMKGIGLGLLSTGDPVSSFYNTMSDLNQDETQKQKQLRLEQVRIEIENAQSIAINTARFKLTNPVLHYADKVYMLGDVSKRENTLSLIDYVNDRNSQAEKLYNYYKTKPNDIKNNYKYIETIAKNKVTFSALNNGLREDYIDKSYNIYKESLNHQISSIIKKHYQENYISSKNVNFSVSFETAKKEFERDFNNIKLLSKEDFISLVNQNGTLQILSMSERLSKLINDCDRKAEEVSEYSYNYEKQKYNTWAAKNHKKQIMGALEQFVYGSLYQPQTGLYTHNPKKNLYLKVLQTVPGGVILTGSYSIGIYEVNNIFLQTSKQFVDGQIIAEPLVAEYKGYYDYTTVLGVKKRIYKFYRYGQNEIKSTFNIPGQPFYFYQPYNI